VSAIQAAAIKAWWAKRFAAGEVQRYDRNRNLEKRRAIDRESKHRARAANPERARANLMKWYRAHRDEQLQKRRAKYAEQIERHRARDRARYLANHEHLRELDLARYAKNPAAKLAIHKKWRDKNRERVRANARRRDALKAATRVGPVDYRLVLAVSGGICGICGQAVDTSNPKAYHYDHKVPLARGGAHVQDNIQLAHAKCNMKKHASVG
jgi:5-methylcytosine-specific restriction endonuclease McrA